MNRWFAPDALFDGQTLRHGVAIRTDGQRIIELSDNPPDATPLRGTLTPGFVDLQVNGGGGVMLNTSPTSDGIRAILAAHHRHGTVALMPTLITDYPDVLDTLADAVLTLHDERGFIGLHIEGPHIAPARRGTHCAGRIRPLDDRTFTSVSRLRAAGIIVMLTLAPEAATFAQIAQLTGLGVVVSLGHTDATAEEMHLAINAGATCGTHLFNAMSPMTGRAPGAVGALINSSCYTGIICDGHHVADEMVALAIRARPRPDRMFLVSDAMATVGGPDQFRLYEQTITLQGGRLVNADGNLAGAHTTQAEGVARLIGPVGVARETALRMAITTPAACIGRPDLAELAGRPLRDVIVLSPDFATHQPLTALLDVG